MPVLAVLICNTLTAIILLAVGSSERFARGIALQAAAVVLPLVNAALLSAYVLGEDDYRDNGISRWDAYRSPGGALGPIFVVSVGLMVVCGLLLGYALLRPQARVVRPTAFVGGLAALFLVTPTIMGFTLN
jgi:hypothetical protein